MSKESINLTLAGWENEEIWDTEGGSDYIAVSTEKREGNNFRFAVASFITQFSRATSKSGKTSVVRPRNDANTTFVFPYIFCPPPLSSPSSARNTYLVFPHEEEENKNLPRDFFSSSSSS